ncbi:hypothetical protein L3Q82_007368 [Scortum barcoo]|uniref:Uncharacterized protein n=1 Tax=Scortum barcoo TaxID=214431 RepID=A0ACB8WT01_9TELE|nr:hypothetical protein L3Q82_007368 [Scortum barcoo]
MNSLNDFYKQSCRAQTCSEQCLTLSEAGQDMVLRRKVKFNVITCDFTSNKMAAIQFPSRTKRWKNYKLVLKEDKTKRVTPSVYTQEMLQSTEDRLANITEVHPPRILELLDMSKTSHHKGHNDKVSLVDTDQPLFQPFPSELIFQNFVPAQTHKLPLLLLNNDKVSRQVRLELQDSEYFHVVGPEDTCSKVAPGMSVTFTVSFTPQENKEGEIWPNMTVQFNIVFKPQDGTLYQQTIYCDVTGRESRLPLTIKGEGMGPKLQLNYNLMNIKDVFIGDKNTYEVLLSNKGLIDAPFRLSSPDTTFGRCFSMSPQEGVVPSGACQVVEVTFHSHILGTFSEDLLLTVTGQPQPLTLTFRGCVVGPTFHFNISEFNFGDVAFGFPFTLICTLFNTSSVPMTFALRVPGDGLGSPSVTCSKQLSDMSKNNWQGSAARDLHAQPAEFTISPAAGSVHARSDVIIKVTLCSNTVGRYRQALVVDVEGVGEEIMTLPINARCVVPDIVVETPVLDFQKCFLDHPYEHQVRLTNNSTLPACYGMLDQKYEESPSLIFGSPVPRGVILPHSSEELPVILLAKAIGKLHHTLRIAVFGSIRPPLEVVLSCIGQGPIVHIQSPQLDFGTIPVLMDITRALHLSNQSPIPAHFTARLSQGRSFCRVEPSEGEVPPESQLELRVMVHLKDTLLFQARLEVSIQDSQTHTIPLYATGSGTTIVSDRPFAPNLDLGTYFSHGSCQYHFKLTNHGQRIHRLYWWTEDYLSSTKTCREGFLPPISGPRSKDILGRGSLPSSGREKPVFRLSPARVELFPGCSVDMVLTGSSDSPKVVRERLVCQGIVGHQSRNEQIMSVDVTCRFVAPVLSISSKQLNFYMEKVPGKSLTVLYEKLILQNVSPLSLSMELSLVDPFSLCEAPGVHSSATTKFLEVYYHGHPQQDVVKLHAEVHFPNLHFSTTTVDFGCVLNCTETQREISITNCSPLPVSYHWAFLDDQKHGSPRPGADADEQSSTQSPARVEEVFDVLPLHGHLQPRDQQVVTVCFYGHKDASREVVALCYVEEGPTYEITLRGEASVISYSLDPAHVDFGLQLFDHEGMAELTLRNTGKIGFKFNIIHPEDEEEEAGGQMKALEEQNEIEEEVRPGQPVVNPTMGYVDAGAEQCLRVHYLPGIPEVFEKRLQLQVAFLQPQDITVTGEGVFPRISLNLPQNLSCYSDVVQQARTTVEVDRVRKKPMNGITTSGEATTEANSTLTYEESLHMEIERTMVKQNALAVTSSLLELRDSQGSSRKWHRLSKFLLPEYVLDFGYVIPGKVLSHTVNVTNTGSVAASFQANHRPLAGTGFSAEIERVKNLPCGETQTFTIKFDLQGANLKMGDISVVMPIQVTGGPTVQVRLCAVVTVPAITVSTESLQFDTVQCGMCQMKTIQLFNDESVPCYWSIAEKVKPFKKVDKFLPLYQRKKVLQEQRPPSVAFEMIPSSGMLSPGERVNVLIKFSPTEGLAYNRQLVVQVAESTQQVLITAQGQGEEPRLEFCPAMLQLGPCLPVSTDVEAEVTVRNPCSFPIEFYSVEFDTQYLEEEKILCLMQGYDENKILLLPPRTPGESLPKELLDYYTEYCSQMKDDAELRASLDAKEVDTSDTHEEGKTRQNDAYVADSKEGARHIISVKPAELLLQMTKEGNSGKMWQLETTPISRAIARHMCVDLSPEGLAARNRRGIAVIVYGAPLTAKSITAAALARHYGGACLTVDAVVTDVLINGTSPVSLTVKHLYDCAAAEYAEKKAKEAGQAVENDTEPGPAADLEASDPAPKSALASHDTVEVLERPTEDSCSQNDSKETENTHFALCLGDVSTLRNLLPEQLLVDVLAERFQLSDCHRGIVIGGLESLFTQSPASTLQVVLKALNNRKHIYVVNLCDSYAALKARERAQREIEEALQKEIADREEQWLQELDEEEYDALPEEEKERIAQGHREKLRQRKLRELQRIAKEQEEKKQQEEIKKSKEDEMKKKSEKGVKNNTKEDSRKMSFMEGEQHCPQIESSVDELQSQFSAYEQSHQLVEHILQHWDRAQGLLLVPLPAEEGPPVSEDATTEKQTPVGKRSKKANSKTISPMPSQMAAPPEADKAGDKVSPQDIVPHIMLNGSERDCPNVTELINGSSLPPLDEVLDDLGLGPSGPPIPPPTTFSVVPFPKTREQSNSPHACDCFTFLVPLGVDEQKKDPDEDVQALIAKEEASATPSKSRSKGSIKESAVTKDKDKKVRESQRSKIQISAKTKAKGSDQSRSPPLQVSSALTTFRWIVPANGEVVLKIWFYSESPGKFEQTFNFELLGTQRNYQLLCRGLCTYPSICRDYTTLFATSKKVPQMVEGIQKTYLIKPGYFEFGPLLCGKTRDRYKENRYPENTEMLVIHNNSGLEAEVQFRFQHDAQASTYLLDPPSMTLKPDQKQELTVWAYPTKVGQMKDSVVCHIKDNPELVIINLSCWGVRPELELENKHLHFDRILLHRRDSRSVTLHNKTALPVSWRLQGVEELGDEFSVPQDQGLISPNSSFPLSLHFRARRPLHIKKILRLEISDVGKILGIVHTENIQVTAEAYDIALDISPDDCLDFGTIKVFEEAKLSLRMKNQGKYEIAYKFTFQRTDPTQPNLESIFTVSPQSGTLMPHEKPTTVQILCRPNKEVSITEQPVLPCQVIEPNIASGGETIAILSIKVSVKSVFSRYKITPACDINFGPLVYGCKKIQSFTIENHGVFETRFTICRMLMDHAPPGKPGGPGKKMPQESHSGRPTGASNKMRCESIQKDMSSTQNRLSMGVFSVSPCTGSLQPGSQQVVTVDCAAEQLGNWNQGLLIDISDRDPTDHPNGIPYRLLAEVCEPGIALDTASIFEEHHLCHNSSQLSSEQFFNAEGIYIREENKFFFNKILVGKTAQARFKLTNSSKVPCVLSLAIKYVASKASRTVEVFDLAATTLSIPSQSHSFAVVTFTPQTMQLYSAVFEAAMEGTSRMTPTFKSKVLEFSLMGEATLPSVCVVRPALRNSAGGPMLQFGRVLVGRRHTLPLVLLNDGNVPAQVQLDMLDKHGVFALRAAPGNTCSSIYSTQLEDTTDSECLFVHRAILRLNVNEQVEFEVCFSSDKPLSVKAKMSLQVEDNQYSSTIIQVSAVAYQEIVSLDNISRSSQELDQEDDVEGNYELLNFGDCRVDCPYQESFTMTNHSSSQVVRFEWPPAGPHVFFSPQVGHLHVGCSKEVTVTFCSSQPLTLTSQPMRCKVCQVQFQQPLDQVADWDDRQRTVQWLSSSKQTSEASQQNVKNKVIKTDPEPCCSVVEGSQWELELRISAVCDYVKFSCNTDTIHFKDTMLYQTRHHQMHIVNHGAVKLEFSFQVLMDPSNKIVNNDQQDGTLTSRRGVRSAGVSGARPASALASVMSLLTGNPELPPISVEPSMGVIEPGAVQMFTIWFSPQEVAQFQGKLCCSIPNLQDEDQAPCILVCGRSLLPHCHFDLKDSDYISGIRRNPEFRHPLDPNTRVIEFNALGISAPSKRCFSVLNPTSKPYSFKWRCEDKGGSPFLCLSPCGTILPGKKVEMCFEYVAEQLDVVESFWSFVIETLSLSVPVLCVGATREPLVYLDRPHLDFKELLLGRKVEQKVDLVSGEEEHFHFSVVQSSLLCEDQKSSLSVRPMTGTVAPKDRLPLSVSFTPCREGCVSFRLVVRVKRKSEPLVLTVKADCFTMGTFVQVERPGGGLSEVNPNHQETLDFGKVEISKQSTFNFLVSNLARFSMEVNFDLTGPSELLQHMEAKPQNSTIEVGRQLQLSLLFSPRGICNLQDVRLSIKVKLGPTFTFAIKGRAVAPTLEFSFTKYNFGKCFLHCPGIVPPSKTLVISNKSEKDISVQCQFKNTSCLEMDFQPDVLSPGAVMEVPVHFHPREAGRYHEKLTFILNSCVTKQVDILGQGIEIKLEVEDPRQRKVKLGSLMLSQKVKKQVVLVNRSPADISFTLQLNTNTPLDSRDLSFSPAGELNLKASGGSCNVEIQFSPRHHISSFTAELQAEFAGLLHHLLTIQGCCQGVEVQLDQDHLAFGAVVQRCQARKKIVMMNTGDIGARFQWKTENFPPELSIVPAKGYICPGMEVPFEVTFSPVELSNDTRYENLSCFVEDSFSPVTLTVTGSCIVASTSKEVVNFVCPVRGSHIQTLPVLNPTNQHCTIQPVIEGEQWSAAPSVTLEPLQNKTYKITYRPLTMTVDGKKHLGSVFFSFPDGTGILYTLQGTAEPPKAEDTIVHELPAKTHHTQLLSVHNWLPKQQRFCVLIEILKPDRPDATVSLKGLEYIDVPALAKREYKMSLFTYREGQYNTKVTFRNMVSGEYLFYLVTFKATSPGVLSTIELETTVRRTASATVQVENPLTTATCLSTECKCADISAPPQHTVPGQSKGSLSFEYQPLHAGETTARLTLCNNELGFFHYDLLLRALPPPPEKTVHFSTSLGSSHSVLVKFINYSRLKTEYLCKTDCMDFIVDKSVGASPGFQAGSEASVEVCFEPHQLGEVKGQLSLSSGLGGEYIFPLHGICLAPKAQGPFSIRAGRNITIPFKNVFLQTTAFSFQVDNPCFTVKGADTILSKKTQNMVISCEAPPGGSPGPWCGKLTISSQRSEGHSKPCSWVYYLKGYRPESSFVQTTCVLLETRHIAGYSRDSAERAEPENTLITKEEHQGPTVTSPGLALPGPHPGARPGVRGGARRQARAWPGAWWPGLCPRDPAGSARNGDVGMGPPSSRLTTRRKVHEGPGCNVVWVAAVVAGGLDDPIPGPKLWQ